ncbi:MAG TPA: hypothetical protein VHK67_08020 [Rhabdochlamydiaceae bacterium]|nr:hypothetical protein [Rhabdochlamydiaceae bacterium]
MSVLGFVRDMVTFPAVWFTGADYDEAREKARNFIYSTARVAIACGIVWGLFKAQYCEPLREVTVPVALFSARVGKVVFSLEPLSLLINFYLLKTAKSKWIAGGYSAAVGVWQCFMQSMRQWTKAPSGFSAVFSVTLQKAALKIDPLTNLMRIAVWKLPETRLGIGLFTTVFGGSQLNVYTIERWNLRDAPTALALKGIVHIAFGLCWIGLYEKYNHRLETTLEKESTYLFRAANWVAPHLAWIATGQQE